MAKCECCQENLDFNEGFTVVATQGKWKGKPLMFCGEQCMIVWDCSGLDPELQGNQGFNLAKDLDKLKPRSNLALGLKGL